MINLKLRLIAAVLAGLTSHAFAIAPNTGSIAKAQVELEVVPTKVTCQINVTNVNGTATGDVFSWTPSLAVGTTGSVITDNAASLKRSMKIDFTNPAVSGGPDVACDTAGSGLDLLFTAHDTDELALTTPYQGKIERSDGTRWFNYAVAVNKTAFSAAVDASAGAGKAIVSYPASAGQISGSDAIDLQGTNGKITITKAAGNTDPNFKLGQYPIEIYLQKAYTSSHFPEVSATAADNVYRGHFTIQASYQ